MLTIRKNPLSFKPACVSSFLHIELVAGAFHRWRYVSVQIEHCSVCVVNCYYIFKFVVALIHSEWKKNFLKINKLVLVGGPDDGVITPWQSR